jgi:hypothetical protein
MELRGSYTPHNGTQRRLVGMSEMAITRYCAKLFDDLIGTGL